MSADRQDIFALVAEVRRVKGWLTTTRSDAIDAIEEALTCHCGEDVAFGYDDEPTHSRGMCQHCDSVRCDAYPGECGR